VRGLRAAVVITGTDTGVGKTIVTAAIAAAAKAAGLTVAVVKPCQSGVGDESETDIDVVTRLAAPDYTKTLEKYPDPLAPSIAARIDGRPAIPLNLVVERLHALASEHDLLLIEGAGGVLVPLGSNDWTVIDLALALQAPAVVVIRPGLGTLNHTALTRLALAHRGVRDLVVLGEWPFEPALVHRTNLRALPPLAGVLPEQVGKLDPDEFQRRCADWLAPELHGTFDPDVFTISNRR
jgi:dethiobiotin synthetase